MLTSLDLQQYLQEVIICSHQEPGWRIVRDLFHIIINSNEWQQLLI